MKDSQTLYKVSDELFSKRVSYFLETRVDCNHIIQLILIKFRPDWSLSNQSEVNTLTDSLTYSHLIITPLASRASICDVTSG